MSRIFKITEKGIEQKMNWDTAISEGEIETVMEFETLKEALDYYENELGGDDDKYGVE